MERAAIASLGGGSACHPHEEVGDQLSLAIEHVQQTDRSVADRRDGEVHLHHRQPPTGGRDTGRRRTCDGPRWGTRGHHFQCQSVLTSEVHQFILTAVVTKETPGTTPSDDPSVGLRAVLALRRLAERVEAEQVARARDQGWSWQQIAEGLGMTRQSVHAKYGGAL
jgi:hypothetical protein